MIKWSDGADTGKTYQGEKWDHIRFDDVDRDGDLDVVANAEEHYRTPGFVTLAGVVCFENPGSAARAAR